ncbi:hypothetical protein KVT40_002458 [Elsinoe batatas]|uniref:Uncharacterized protein n=1 Tax=Elsinoe batatas TaxID=2601811 RepID=A0A8K0PMA7_9PEZI|nr:hypothetical protein KVT40_002458 [Elsinoe batatas]
MLAFVSQRPRQVTIAAVAKFTSTRRSPPFPPPPVPGTPPDAVHDQSRSIQCSHGAGWPWTSLLGLGRTSSASLKRALLPSPLALETRWRLLHHADQDDAARIRHQGRQRIWQQRPERVHGHDGEQGSEQGI